MGSAILKRIATGLPLHERDWDMPMASGRCPQAAVLVALTDQAEPNVLLGRKARHLRFHPGEIAFAGGKRDVTDTSPWHTARREALEEVGIPQALITPLGELEPMLTRTGFEVFPCVASVPADVRPVVDPGEFDSVFFAPLAEFADHRRFRLETVSDAHGSRNVPHYRIGNDNVWGVTAAILVLLVNLAYDAGLDLQRDWKLPP